MKRFLPSPAPSRRRRASTVCVPGSWLRAIVEGNADTYGIVGFYLNWFAGIRATNTVSSLSARSRRCRAHHADNAVAAIVPDLTVLTGFDAAAAVLDPKRAGTVPSTTSSSPSSSSSTACLSA
ncbi:hypothetical protein F5X96DRAFT_671097 [Biscogniauxia mediterranea]|nr:hypothetical protein F5X96DRAFT_671097 [Biscogniauxia mediterranea]